MSTLISIIIPVYNRAHTLPDCIRSVLNQSYQNFEVILIDDGSTDGTAALCEQYAKDDPRFKLLSGAHTGVSAARNKGLEAANGEYVFFLDSDDAIHPLVLEVLAGAMDNSDAGIGGTNVRNIPDQYWTAATQKFTALPYEQAVTTLQTPAQTLQAFFRGHTPVNMIGGVMMRRSLIGNTRFRTDLTISEDYFFIYENLIKDASAVFLQQYWYFGRLHAQNSSNDYSYEGFLSRFRRRKLVWESEDAMGRSENAAKQKLNGLFVYLRCIENQPQAQERKKMSAVLKQHRKEIVPALSTVNKLRFYLNVYAPFTHRIVLWLKIRLQR